LLYQLGFLLVFSLAMTPMLAPLAVEAIIDWLKGTRGGPIFLLLSVLECAAVVVVYRYVLPLQGELLQSREQQILETVTTKEE
jgi:hypothetical protein